MEEQGVSQTPVMDAACPHLRLVDDAATRCLFPTFQHGCFAQPDQVRRPAADVQSRLCLTSGHTECEWYRPGGAQWVRLDLGVRRASPRLMRPALMLKILVAVGLIVGSVVGLGLTVAALKTERQTVTVEPVPSSDAIQPAKPQPTFMLQARPPSSEVAVAAVGPALPTPVLTRVSASLASDPRPRTGLEQTHVVAEGESLSAIAQLYDVEIGELATRNGLSSDARLAIGDVLIIPAPAR